MMYIIGRSLRSRRCLRDRPSSMCWYSQNFRLAGLLLKQDLYEENQKLNSSYKIPYEGRKPSFYERNQTDFIPQYFEKGVGNRRMLDLMDHDLDFANLIESRTEPIQKFLGHNFPLLPREKLSILCGLTNIELEFLQSLKDRASSESNNSSFDLNHSPSVLIETDKLRKIGKSKVDLDLSINTVFISQKYLSTSTAEIDHNLKLFGDYDVIVPEFMRKNLMYSCILPFRGAMRDGTVHSLQEYEATKEAILNKTCMGSFYTILGILYVKFDREMVGKFVTEKFVNGNLGLVNIAMDMMTK